MKRLLILLAVVLMAHSAAASMLRERDVLLTSSGVLYTVDAVHDPDVEEGRSPYYLTMSVQEGEERVTRPVPASLYGGAHGYPSLAHDPESDTLFLFWQETLHRGVASNLLFASYNQGRWSDVTELDSVTWRLRRNLRIAVTRSIESVDESNNRVQVPQVVVHAVWWEENGFGEFARYAMLGLDNGVVTSTDFRYLVDFIGGSADSTSPGTASAQSEALRHPAVVSTPRRDSVDVIFSDATTSDVHRLRIRPALDGRVRIPIGVRGPVMRNLNLTVASDSRVAAVVDEESVALYTVTAKALEYAVFANGAWSAQRSVALGPDVTADIAVNALKRMVSAQ